jgi:peptidoglycan/LPS O-acetylase OafA/YrhL
MSKSYLTELKLLPKILCTAFCAIYVGKYAPPCVVIQQDYSYGMYLYAWPIQQAIVSVTLSIGWRIGPIGLFVAATLLTFCIAVPSWHFVERPALRLQVRGVWPQPKVRTSVEG